MFVLLQFDGCWCYYSFRYAILRDFPLKNEYFGVRQDKKGPPNSKENNTKLDAFQKQRQKGKQVLQSLDVW